MKKNNKNQEKLNSIVDSLVSVLVLMLLAFAFATTISFYEGAHNADVGQNIRYLNSEFDLDIVDLASDGNSYTGTQLYILGMEGMKNNFILMTFISFAIGIFLGYLVFNPKKQ